MYAIPDRHLLTGLFVTYLTTELTGQVATGRGTAPPEGGWSQGQPGTGIFHPYVTIKTAVGRPSTPETLGLGRAVPRWSMGYRLSVSDALESAADTTAHIVRKAAIGFHHDTGGPALDLGGSLWVIERVTLDRMGPSSPNRSTDPPYWDVTDDVSVWLSLVRS